ncbi:uncharacterized protein LOC119596751 isoform X1 [Penaeus monodon]|uniref:uncharacterized protein LOC119596751 isoform X1 n=1 Tax=Penaeus monodon TaxID=6687 RepID=UPI0018A7696D|nr:uncharacterized protein LOC119596751 isoform X1 [Penaeus monodon]
MYLFLHQHTSTNTLCAASPPEQPKSPVLSCDSRASWEDAQQEHRLPRSVYLVTAVWDVPERRTADSTEAPRRSTPRAGWRRRGSLPRQPDGDALPRPPPELRRAQWLHLPRGAPVAAPSHRVHVRARAVPPAVGAKAVKSPTGVTAAASRDLIQRMLECSFSEEWSSWAKARKNVWKPENHEVCEGHRGSDYHQCLRDLCQSSVFKVIKTIKLRVWWAGDVLLGGGVKVVHLVRDPRGSFTSLARLSMVQADYKVWCPRILQDLEMVSTMRSLFPESFTSVKYEDLCRDPWGTATKLWNFINNESNTSLPVSWRTFLHRHTNTNSLEPYGTERDTRRQIGAWREKINGRMLSEIEHHCGSVIDMLGHTRFHSLANARNGSIPLDEMSGT